MEHFLEHAVSAWPLLPLLNGHVTHYQPGVIQIAEAHRVSILFLPSHTTHKTQPLDCGMFAPLKLHWSLVGLVAQKNRGKVITKFNFNSLFAKAWLSAVVPSNIMTGFKTCGVYLFNWDSGSATHLVSHQLAMRTEQGCFHLPKLMLSWAVSKRNCCRSVMRRVMTCTQGRVMFSASRRTIQRCRQLIKIAIFLVSKTILAFLLLFTSPPLLHKPLWQCLRQ